MKITLLRQRVTALGGAETTLGYLVRGLAAAGHAVTVRLITFALNSRRLLQLSEPQLVFSLERVLNPQVYRAGDGCHREWLARRAPYWPVWDRAAQHLSLFHQTMLHLERRLFAFPGLKKVIANSRQVRDEVIRHYGVAPENIRVIYNGLDRGRFKPLAAEERAKVRRRLGATEGGGIILFVGSGFERKGLSYLLQAFSGLKDMGCELWVVGKGQAAPYQRLVEHLGLADRVRFWGTVGETAPYYQAATVLALPTLYDPCSNVVLEALACGTPVLTTAANGATEFLTPKENGAIVPQPDDIAGLRGALAEFLDRGEDPQTRQAAAAAVAGLSWEATVGQTIEVLEEV
jgi:UDP-glucose:(heptosyl)LPS alpha-1,3-glucosyltransferase